MVLISVIVPVYNAEKYIRKCMNSILSQSLSDIEVILIDDGSPDSSPEICDEYKDKDNRIIVVHKENGGAASARNVGLDIANGKYVCFMDPDDWYPDNDVLRDLYDCIENQKVKMVGGFMQSIDADGKASLIKPEFTNLVFPDDGLIKFSDYQYDYYFTSYIYEKEFIDNNKIRFPDYLRYEDPVFLAKVANMAGSIYKFSRVVYSYRLSDGFAKNFPPNIAIDCFRGMKENLKYSRENNLDKLHYITYMRLTGFGSIFVDANFDNERFNEIFAEYIFALGKADLEWLSENGYDIKFNELPNALKRVLVYKDKYTKIKSNKIYKILMHLRKVLKKIF